MRRFEILRTLGDLFGLFVSQNLQFTGKGIALIKLGVLVFCGACYLVSTFLGSLACPRLNVRQRSFLYSWHYSWRLV